ncbi:MAG: type II secretion system F family protein [Candidatus Gastranaerophilaceae bacterium]|jgi:tight adherence protein C
MNIIFFIILAVTITIFIYYNYLGMDEDENILKQRLDKISPKQSDKYTEEELPDAMTQIKNFLIQNATPFLNTLSGETKQKLAIKTMLVQAGYVASDEDVIMFTAHRLTNCLFVFIFSLILLIIIGFNINSLLLILACPMLAYVLPIMELKAKGKKRAEEINYNLPDALDLLTVCVEAGLGLDAALVRVAKEFSKTSDILASEFEKTNNDILAGSSRQEAFRSLASRNNVPELKSFVALLIQSDKLGTSIAQSLRVHCDSVRTRRRQRVEELAQKASVKMTIPLVFFILPSMFVVILAPALISLMRNMH